MKRNFFQMIIINLALERKKIFIKNKNLIHTEIWSWTANGQKFVFFHSCGLVNLRLFQLQFKLF
jgi:hypothetical protein